MGLYVLLAVGVLVFTVALPAVSQGAPAYATNSLVVSGIRETTVGGFNGVVVNYTSTFASSFTAFVYLDLTNSLGQSVSVNLGFCSFSASQEVGCFVALGTNVPTGVYTAHVFATTTGNVPVSLTRPIQVSA
jgi:hypothetical protein